MKRTGKEVGKSHRGNCSLNLLSKSWQKRNYNIVGRPGNLIQASSCHCQQVKDLWVGVRSLIIHTASAWALCQPMCVQLLDHSRLLTVFILHIHASWVRESQTMCKCRKGKRTLPNLFTYYFYSTSFLCKCGNEMANVFTTIILCWMQSGIQFISMRYVLGIQQAKKILCQVRYYCLQLEQ